MTAVCGHAQAQIVAAVLPSSRSVAVGHSATAFATIINAGSTVATGCGIALPAGISAGLTFNTTNPATNGVVGATNATATIQPGGFQTFVFAITPSAAFASTDIALSFTCTGLDPAPTLSGINTLLLTSTATAGPDMVALAATTSGNGIVSLPNMTGSAAFAVATSNVGAADSITVSADTGSSVTLPVAITICQTVPSTGACMGTPNPTVTVSVPANGTPTFGVFVTGTGNIADLPGANRITVRFKASNGTVVGSTSVATRTTGYVPPATNPVAFVVSPPATATAGTAYTSCYCSPPSGSNGLCGSPTQGNPSGGNPPYHFQLGSGGGFPPLGVVLLPNGCLSGTPTVAGTRNFTVCAIDLNGTQICRPTSVTTTAPSQGKTYTGALSGAGDYTRNFPGFTTCSFHNAYNGTITVSLSTPSGGSPSGTVSITGTWTSTATGGSTSNFTCLDTSTALDSSGPLSISGSNVTWSTSFTTPTGSIATGAFSGTYNATSLTGTVVETINTSSGSTSIPVSLR